MEQEIHFGIKPFFYSENEDKTYFASEKKSILLAVKNDDVSKCPSHYNII